jgi:hypothetical protein
MGTTTKQWAISKQGSGRPENEYLSRTTTGNLLIKLSLSLSHSHPWAEEETLIPWLAPPQETKKSKQECDDESGIFRQIWCMILMSSDRCTWYPIPQVVRRGAIHLCCNTRCARAASVGGGCTDCRGWGGGGGGGGGNCQGCCCCCTRAMQLAHVMQPHYLLMAQWTVHQSLHTWETKRCVPTCLHPSPTNYMSCLDQLIS